MKVSIELPKNAKSFKSKTDWDNLVSEMLNSGLHIKGQPVKFPCYGWPVFTEYNEGSHDFSVYAFLYK